MKRFIQAVSFLGLAFVFGGVSANAQSNVTRVDANIPFDFMVGDKQFSAGKYVLRITQTTVGAKGLEILNENREMVYNGFLINNGDRAKDAAELNFDRSNGVASLARIITENGGYSMPESGRATQIASRKKAATGNVVNN